MNGRSVVLLMLVTLGLLVALPASNAGAVRYTVAQCGWHVGQDAGWLDTSADKFVRSSYCQVPASADPFDGVHLTSATRSSTRSVSGTKFARWRWQAPAGTGIVTVNGHRWQVLRDGFQHRIGSVPSGGSFSPFLQLQATDTVRRSFSSSFSPFAAAIESRLLCARSSDKACVIDQGSSVGVRGLTITIDDSARPTIGFSGALTGGAWLRGSQSLTFTSKDVGSGLRYGQTLIDGSVRAQTEHGCSKAFIAGQWRGTKMQPCAVAASGSHSVATGGLSDGPHRVKACALDFAGNSGCTAEVTLRTDNTAPAAPRGLKVPGGEGWRNTNSFELGWVNPDQGAAAPIATVHHRVTGAHGYSAGAVARSAAPSIAGLTVPAAGEFRASVWLGDAAGNVNPNATADTVLRFDDIPPRGYFLEPDAADPELLRVPVADEHSGIAEGRISYRPRSGGQWKRLPTEREAADGGEAFTATFPSERVPAGAYEFQAVVTDRAGNALTTGQRDNGSRLILQARRKRATALSARLRSSGKEGTALSVAFGSRPRLSGRLTATGVGGLAGRRVEISQEPDAGSRAGRSVVHATTDRDGYFDSVLPAGTSRKLSVAFIGDGSLSASRVGPLRLRVRGALTLVAIPRRLETGAKLRLRGRLRTRGAILPARGGLVAIQYFERGPGRWRPVMVTRLDRHGRFEARYRFRYITGRARIRMRAKLLPSSRIPFESAPSRAVTVRVRG